MAALLIAQGANVKAKDSSGNMPLHLAAQGGHKDLAELLITKGADINVKSSSGSTPLHEAAARRHKDLVELLVARGADVNVEDRQRRTPLRRAKQQRQKEIVELLRKHGAEEWPLHEAATEGRIDQVRLLILEGTDVNAKDKAGRTALHEAVHGGHMEVVKLLIAKGANVNAEGSLRGTPLHVAARSGHKDVAKLLILKGADVNIKNRRGESPLSRAKASGHKEIVELLRKHGARDIKPLDQRKRPGGGFSPGGMPGSGESLDRMEERFQNMSEAERDRFRAEMRERFGGQRPQGGGPGGGSRGGPAREAQLKATKAFLKDSELAPYVAEVLSKMEQSHPEAFQSISSAISARNDKVIINYKMQFQEPGRDGKLISVTRSHSHAMSLSEAQSKERVEGLFAEYVKEYEARKNLEEQRHKASRRYMSLHPGIVDTVPPGFNLDPALCPDFLLGDSRLAPRAARVLYEMKRKHNEAFWNLSQVIVRDDMVVIKYIIWSLEPNQDGKLMYSGKTHRYTTPLSETRSREGMKALFAGYIRTYEAESAEAREESEELWHKASKKITTIHPAIVEAAPLRIDLTSCPGFFLEDSELAPHAAEALSEMRQRHHEAFRDLSAVSVKDGMVVFRYIMWSLEPDEYSRFRGADKIYKYTMPLSEVCSKEGVERLFAGYLEEHETKSAEYRKKMREMTRGILKAFRTQIHPDVKETIPYRYDITHWTDFMTADSPRAQLAAKLLSEMEEEHSEAFRNITKIIGRGTVINPIVRLRYVIWSLQPGEDGKLINLGKIYYHTMPLYEARGSDEGTRMPQRKFVATGILVFDFELFIGGLLCHFTCQHHFVRKAGRDNFFENSYL